MLHPLILGGTTEASRLAHTLAAKGIDAVFSYAGRTDLPVEQPLPTRIGGFGGAEGLARYLEAERISHVIDATHPFAAQMSRNAVAACGTAGIPLLALERPGWTPEPGDRWQIVPDIPGAVAALPADPARIFLAIGRQHLEPFARCPQHRYLLRLVDLPPALPLQRAEAVIARGPFTMEGDLALLTKHSIDLVVAKNSGGAGAAAKLVAARRLKLPVILIDRPALPFRPSVETVEEVLCWLHEARLGV